MWFNPTLLYIETLQRIIRSSHNRLEVEISELLLDIMAAMDMDSISPCLNDLVVLPMYSQVKAGKHQVRKMVQEYWKLIPASNGLIYTTYQSSYNRSCHYGPIKRAGCFYTVTKEQLKSLQYYHFSVELLDMGINTLTINDIYSQQNSNKPREKLGDCRHPSVDFFFGERLVEKMLKGYEAVYRHIISTVHQINKFSSTSKPHVI